MKFKATIAPDGKMTQEVLERNEGEECIKVLNYGVGQQLSDEVTGPPCDEVHERQL